MSSEIAVKKAADFASLAPVSAIEFRRKSEQFVTIPARGGTRWVWDTVIGPQHADTLDGLAVVFTPPQLDVWPTEGQAKKGTLPYFRSLDGVTAYIVGTDHGDLDLSTLESAKLPLDEHGNQPYLCERIPAFNWVNTNGKNSRRAKEQSTIGILRKGEQYPLFVTLSTTSSVALRDFFSQLARVGIPHYRAVISLGLVAKTGGVATYSVVVPKFLYAIEAEDGEAIKRSYTDVVTPRLRGTTSPPRSTQAEADSDTLDAAGVPF